jgi:hypothetical protein
MKRLSLVLQTLAFAPLFIMMTVALSGHVIVKSAHEDAFILISLLSIIALFGLGLFWKPVRRQNWIAILIWVPVLAVTATISSDGR